MPADLRPGRRLAQLADLPVTVLRGVGDAVARDLGELDVTTVFDLVTHYPRRHVDGTRMVTVDRLTPGEKATVLATVRRVNAPPSRPGRGRRGTGQGGTRHRGRRWAHAGGLLQPVVACPAAADRHRRPVLRSRLDLPDALQMVNPTVEVLHGGADSRSRETTRGPGGSIPSTR